MGGDNTRLFFALLIGLSIGFLGGFLTSSQMSPTRPAVTVSGGPAKGGMAKELPANTGTLPEGHPKIDFQKEIDALLPLVKENPKDFHLLSQLGNLYYDMSKFNDAVIWYEKALVEKPDELGVRTDMGTSFHYVGQHSRALQEFETVLKKNPTFPQALHNMGIVKASAGDNKAAIALWEKLLATNPDYPGNPQVRENLAKLKAGQSIN
jgi:tetratricopeptide (TPR) repeat protein